MKAGPTALAAVMVCVKLALTACASAQVNQRNIAQDLLRTDVAARNRALETAIKLGPANTGPELRVALIKALEQEGQIHARRHDSFRRGESLPPLEDPEFILAVSRTVAQLRDPNAIPALAGALGTGFTVIRALAGFGERAAPAVLAVVTNADSYHEAVNEGLIALRLMVESSQAHPLSAGTTVQIKRAAEQRLNTLGQMASTGSTLRWAIDLAVTLGDPDLRRIVESLAADRRQVMARGVSDPELIARTQKRATERLAGMPAMPRP